MKYFGSDAKLTSSRHHQDTIQTPSCTFLTPSRHHPDTFLYLSDTFQTSYKYCIDTFLTHFTHFPYLSETFQTLSGHHPDTFLAIFRHLPDTFKTIFNQVHNHATLWPNFQLSCKNSSKVEFQVQPKCGNYKL